MPHQITASPATAVSYYPPLLSIFLVSNTPCTNNFVVESAALEYATDSTGTLFGPVVGGWVPSGVSVRTTFTATGPVGDLEVVVNGDK